MTDITIISDLHLNSKICQHKKIEKFLDNLKTNRLVINGDFFDSFSKIKNMKNKHWYILNRIAELSFQFPVNWIEGNHDQFNDLPDKLTKKLNNISLISEREKVIIQNGDKNFYITHGHLFDTFLQSNYLLTIIGDIIYNALQTFDKSHKLAMKAKRSCKEFLAVANEVRLKAMDTAKLYHCNIAICGHTHLPELSERYVNSGSFTDKHCSYIEITDGEVELKYI